MKIKKGDHLIFVNKYEPIAVIDLCISDPFAYSPLTDKINTRRVFDSDTSLCSSVGRMFDYCINRSNNTISYNEESWTLTIIRC